MPVALGETVYTPPAPQNPPRKPWTREECEACERAGLWEGQRYELVQGELINKMPKYLRHVLGVRRLVQALQQIFGWDLVLAEASIDVAAQDHATSEPEPDAIVLKRSPSEIRGVEPAANDIALAAEVADTTLDHDLTIKAALYARAEIPEYWVLDLNGRRLIVHRDPSGSVYKSVVAYDEQERITSLAAPDHEVLVADLLAF
jgi:Uma2 family endonuclease